jgi:hypothetical protein
MEVGLVESESLPQGLGRAAQETLWQSSTRVAGVYQQWKKSMCYFCLRLDL